MTSCAVVALKPEDLPPVGGSGITGMRVACHCRLVRRNAARLCQPRCQPRGAGFTSPPAPSGTRRCCRALPSSSEKIGAQIFQPMSIPKPPPPASVLRHRVVASGGNHDEIFFVCVFDRLPHGRRSSSPKEERRIAAKFLKVLEPRLITSRRCGNVIHQRRVFHSSGPIDPQGALLGNREEGEGAASPPPGSIEK